MSNNHDDSEILTQAPENVIPASEIPEPAPEPDLQLSRMHEPALIVWAGDACAPDITRAYAALARRKGAAAELIDAVLELADAMVEWQTKNGCEIPSLEPAPLASGEPQPTPVSPDGWIFEKLGSDANVNQAVMHEMASRHKGAAHMRLTLVNDAHIPVDLAVEDATGVWLESWSQPATVYADFEPQLMLVDDEAQDRTADEPAPLASGESTGPFPPAPEPGSLADLEGEQVALFAGDPDEMPDFLRRTKDSGDGAA